MDFTDKNKARKEAREAALNRGIHIKKVNEARKRRRLYGGMFGLSATRIFNDLAVGTTASVRTAKKEVSA